MRHTTKAYVVAVLFSLAAALSADNRLLAADHNPPAAAKPSAPRACPTAVKLKDIATHLGRALSIAADLFSGNEADLLSNNKTALLSGNTPTLLSGNTPTLLSGNAPKVLSENTTPILSGNTISVLSNVKIEIHIDNSGKGSTGGTTAPPPGPKLKR